MHMIFDLFIRKIKFQIHGTIMAFGELSDYHFPNNSKLHYWLTFESVQNLVVEGPGTINGNGDKWWQSSCKQNNKTHKSVVCQFIAI